MITIVPLYPLPFLDTPLLPLVATKAVSIFISGFKTELRVEI